jgi:threonine/homoserine/homoserine lactone efflux protein
VRYQNGIMIDIEKIILFIALSTIVCAAPGPTVFFTLSNGISGDRRKAIFGILGTVSANIIWISCCAIGVAALIRDSHSFFKILKYAGAIYLFHLGILSMRNKSTLVSKAGKQNYTSVKTVYFQGVLTTLTNPKALLYYMAFFPQFVSGQIPYALEIYFLGLCYIIIIFIVLGVYVFAADMVSSIFKRQRFNKFANKVIGVGFIGAAISVIGNK